MEVKSWENPLFGSWDLVFLLGTMPFHVTIFVQGVSLPFGAHGSRHRALHWTNLDGHRHAAKVDEPAVLHAAVVEARKGASQNVWAAKPHTHTAQPDK